MECIYRKDAAYHRILAKVQQEAEARKSEDKMRAQHTHTQLIYHCPLPIWMFVRLCVYVLCLCGNLQNFRNTHSHQQRLVCTREFWQKRARQAARKATNLLCLSACLSVCPHGPRHEGKNLNLFATKFESKRKLKRRVSLVEREENMATTWWRKAATASARLLDTHTCLK